MEYGVIIGWLSPMQPLLQANYTDTNMTSPLGEDSTPLSEEEVSWLASIMSMGGILGTALYGFIVSRLGRRAAALLAMLPFLAAYVIIIFATDVTFLLIARFIAGLGGAGCCVVIPIYIGETAENDVRGVLGAFFSLFVSTGILLSYIVGSYTTYMTNAVFGLILPIIFLIVYFWLPETPTFYLLNNREPEAYKAMSKLRGGNQFYTERDIQLLKSSINDAKSNAGQQTSVIFLLKDCATRKGMILGLAAMSVQQLGGISCVINYTVSIFEATNSGISPHLATIVVGVLQLLGAVFGTLLMDKAGRRVLFLVSSFGMGVTLIPLALYFNFKLNDSHEELLSTLDWVPLMSLSVYIVLYSVGCGTVTFVLISEFFAAEVRSIATSICVTYVWVLLFVTVKLFPTFSAIVGIDVCFGFFSAASLLGGLYLYFTLPETKGRSIDTILNNLRGYKGKAGSHSQKNFH